MKMKRLDNYLDKIMSRRFQVLIFAIVIFFITKGFSGDNLLWVFGIYIGFDTAEKIARR